MDIRAIVSPTIQDRVALEEFADALIDRAPQIEYDIARLKKAPGDREITADLFRAVHNIKGDGSLCKFELAVFLAHPIESLMGRFRDGEIQFSDVLAELILLTVDDLNWQPKPYWPETPRKFTPSHAGTRAGKGCGSSSVEIEKQSSLLIEEVTGFKPVTGNLSKAPPKVGQTHRQNKSDKSDLSFFRSLAMQLESRSPLFKGRTMRILRLAQETNKAGGNAVDPVQLEAAVYCHDIGMMYLPESLWLKIGNMNEQEKIAMRNHPGFAAGMLQRMPGWEPAAEIVSQHHEMPDGGGYPSQLKAPQICAGAKILAIVDAFEAVMLKHIHRGKNRSVLRAIAEINACDKQFAPEWITPFNAVIRKTIES